MTIRSTFLTAALGALALTATTAPALAGEPAKGRTSVSHADLDLDSEAGRAELNKRYQQAARDLCGIKGETPRGSQQRYCFGNTSKQLALQAEQVVARYQAEQGKGG